MIRDQTTGRGIRLAEQRPEYANDLLPRLRTLETRLTMSLDLVRRKIADTERREVEQRHGQEHRPPAPDWLIKTGRGGRDPAFVLSAAAVWRASEPAASSGTRRRGP
ncbi:hypothetical protein ACWCOW_37615 [Streptomyces sp. NPDC001939]